MPTSSRRRGPCVRVRFWLPVASSPDAPRDLARVTPSGIEGLRGPAPRGYNGDDAVLVQMRVSYRRPMCNVLSTPLGVYVGMADGRGTLSVNDCSSPIRHRGYVTYRKLSR
jgi:hypothetical protein